MKARTNPPYARGVSQLMYVGDDATLPEPRSRWWMWALGALVAWKLLK